jgi:hypothetical protein
MKVRHCQNFFDHADFVLEKRKTMVPMMTMVMTW